jgi:anti-anti-sigma regulatory factor
MLRITVHDDREAVRLQLEGHLAGPWLQALEECWRSLRGRRRKRVLWVDLTSVTFIDAAGKAFLARMRRGGANFIAPGLLTRSIVEELPDPGTGIARDEDESR